MPLTFKRIINNPHVIQVKSVVKFGHIPEAHSVISYNEKLTAKKPPAFLVVI